MSQWPEPRAEGEEEARFVEAIREARRRFLESIPEADRPTALDRLHRELRQVLQSHWPDGGGTATFNVHALLAAHLLEPELLAKAADGEGQP